MKEDYYKAYEKRYSQVHQTGQLWEMHKYSREVIDTINEYNITKDDKILDLGCGEGRDAIYLLDNGYNVLAVDYSTSAIQKCNELTENKYKNNFKQFDLITDNIANIKPNLEPSARIVMKSLFSGGMAISIAGSSRPASGSEHLFSHALDKILDKPALHGEQCGIGTIMMMYLHGGDWRVIKNALESVQAPTTAAEVGISEEEIIDALVMANKLRPERYTILGDNGISREAAYELAYKTEVI